MENLSKYLDTLRELNDYRDRAKELRKKGLRPLRTIKDINLGEKPRILCKKVTFNGKKEIEFNFDKWTSSNNSVELALLAKIQNHRDICENDDDNNTADADVALKNRLAKITLKDNLMPSESYQSNSREDMKSVPVLAAARAMQVLTSRSETVIYRASMISYYRILRELYGAAPPDWTVGAARAGVGGTTSAFVTSECIRALFSFRDRLFRTAHFYRETTKLLERYNNLRKMITSLGKSAKKNHPLYRWADKTMEASWLDWYITTNLRHQQIALYYHSDASKAKISFDDERFNEVSNNLPNKLILVLPKHEGVNNRIDVDKISKYFKSLPKIIVGSVIEARRQLEAALEEIDIFRQYEKESKDNGDVQILKEKKERFQRSASAHLFARQAIEDAIWQTKKAETLTKENLNACVKEKKEAQNSQKKDKDEQIELEYLEIKYLKNILIQMADLCEDNAEHINRIAAPTKQFIKGVLRRELSNSASLFDAGELVFAATTFGAMTDWKPHELLNRACDELVRALPESGRLPTKRPLHTTTRGYRLLPIGCEMTRSLAQLFENMNFEFDSQIVGRMLNIFEEKLILLDDGEEKNKCCGWNFESSPNPDCPCIWVSSVSVLALDRLIRMLNSRINNAVMKHFEVIKPEKPHIDLPIGDLIFGDYGFFDYFYSKFPKTYEDLRPLPILLGLMRAHVMRASLPRYFSENFDGKIYSSILYGPPGTGKTTIAEVLAYNCGKPLIKLSPSDLIVQGEEFIEGRARDIFEALSMLTQTVIIFDEFEPMLKTRKPKDITEKNKLENQISQTMLDYFTTAKEKLSMMEPNDQHQFLDEINSMTNKMLKKAEKPSEFDGTSLRNIAEELKEIRKKDDPKVRFLLAGMLPKLLKLHDAAKEQSIIYFLGTNVLKDIDLAARRSGRFDLKMPIYNPCPLSRAGNLLYRLAKKIDEDKSLKLYKDRIQLKRFLDVILTTTNESASELAQKYFNNKKTTNLDYVLQKVGVYQPTLKEDKINELKKEKIENLENLEASEIEEYDWLIGFESYFKQKYNEFDGVANDQLVEFLGDCLKFEPELRS